ncbi:MAG: amidohydrolase [Saprospiraceae bacterium]
MEKEIIQELTDHIFENLVKIRRHLHQHPELSYQEVETGKFISKTLSEWGIPHKYGIADNGVVALIEGKNPGKKVIALRGDIDALPIEEANDVPYKSKNVGVMHACGHDVHTTSLLGAAYILYNTRDQWEGTVKCIFQPAEEKIAWWCVHHDQTGCLRKILPRKPFSDNMFILRLMQAKLV